MATLKLEEKNYMGNSLVSGIWQILKNKLSTEFSSCYIFPTFNCFKSTWKLTNLKCPKVFKCKHIFHSNLITQYRIGLNKANT